MASSAPDHLRTPGLISNRPCYEGIKLVDGFTKRYNITWLAYHEATNDVSAALAREKQLKRWSRSKKLALVETLNPQWKDLAQEWYAE